MKRKTKANLGKLLMDTVRIASEFLEPEPEIVVQDEPEPEPAKSKDAKLPNGPGVLEERAFEWRGEGTPLPTKLDHETKEPRVAWAEAAAEQIKMETRFIAATASFMMAAGIDASNAAHEVEAMARTAALWWHGKTEDDVPKS